MTATADTRSGPSGGMNWRRSSVVALAALPILLAAGALWLAAGSGGDAPAAPAPPFDDTTGIRVLGVGVIGGGGVLDVRFRVIDPNRAGVVHSGMKVVDEDGGEVLQTRFHFHSNSKTYSAGAAYYELLVNSGGAVRPGDLVTVVVGGARLEHVRAQ